MSSSKPSLTRVFFTSTIGLKVVMALSGFALAGFVLGHMTGHLKVFAGREAYNDYAHFLYSLGELLWLARLGLLGLLAAHVYAAVTLAKRNREARPSRYAVKRSRATTVHARIMLWSGLTILAYVIYHVLHFTIPVVHTEYMNPAQPRDVYTYFVQSFQDPLIVFVYTVANVLLASHLSHALTSMFRTLGLSSGRYRGTFEKVGPVFAIVVLAGFLSVPYACLFGIVTL